MVSVLALFSNDPSSNPADAYSFSIQFVFEKNENKNKKRPGLAHFLKMENLYKISYSAPWCSNRVIAITYTASSFELPLNLIVQVRNPHTSK